MLRLIKILVFNILFYSGIAYLSMAILNIWNRGQYIRVLNFHCIPPQHQDDFKKLLLRLSKIFNFVSFYDFKKFLNGVLSLPKASLLLTFDDGLKTHKTVVANILDQINIQGCFFVTLQPIVSSEPIFAPDLGIQIYGDDKGELLSKEDILELSKKHIIGSHTVSHTRMKSGESSTFYQNEILDSKLYLTKLLGQEVDIFCWVGGEFDSYSSEAMAAIKAAQYQFSFMTNNSVVKPNQNPLYIQRTNIEVNWSWPRVVVSLSGLYDLFYFRKRKLLKNKLNNRAA